MNINDVTVQNFRCSLHGKVKPDVKPSCPKCKEVLPNNTFREEEDKRFDELNIHISPPVSLATEEVREKLKYFMPMAFDLLKPSLKSFLHDSHKRLCEKLVGELKGLKQVCACDNLENEVRSEDGNIRLSDVISLINQTLK